MPWAYHVRTIQYFLANGLDMRTTHNNIMLLFTGKAYVRAVGKYLVI
jgi:hypothetical protein